MPELIKTLDTNIDSVNLTPNNALTLYKTSTLHIWSIQSNKFHSLREYFHAAFNTEPQFKKMFFHDKYRLIQLSPTRAYLIFENPTLPHTTKNYLTMLTDVSHGYCELCLSGPQCFEFVSLYVSADLTKAVMQNTGYIRCRFGQYSCLFYWDDHHQIRILIERSYAQSLHDYLNCLILRHE